MVVCVFCQCHFSDLSKILTSLCLDVFLNLFSDFSASCPGVAARTSFGGAATKSLIGGGRSAAAGVDDKCKHLVADAGEPR
jgi:hypothetical protein